MDSQDSESSGQTCTNFTGSPDSQASLTNRIGLVSVAGSQGSPEENDGTFLDIS